MIGDHPLPLNVQRLADVADVAYNRPGVYAIWIRDTCVYIGYSHHVRGRLLQHRQLLRKGKHSSAVLQKMYAATAETEITATLLPLLPDVTRQELAWLERLRPAGNTDLCSADFNPKTRQLRRQARLAALPDPVAP